MMVRLSSDVLSAQVSDLGAELQSLTTSDGSSLLWHGDPAFWSGRSPILFPIVGKAPGDQIEVDGVLYPMGQHGFARRSLFALTEQACDFCRHELVANDETRAVFPFEFRLALSHRLSGAVLKVEASVENTGSVPLPFGLGFHPAFAWPLPWAKDKIHMVTLDNGAEPLLAHLENGLLDAARLPSPFRKGELRLSHSLFAQDALIFPEGAGDGLRYGPKDGPSLRFHFKGLPNLALWTKAQAPFVGIEPWHGMAATAEGGQGLRNRPYTMDLLPGTVKSFAFSVEIEPERAAEKLPGF